MSEQRPTPSRRTATEAMRLRPATRPSEPTSGVSYPLDELVEALLALHASTETLEPAFCRECLTSYPCRTARLARGETDTPAPPEEGSQ